MQETTKTLKVYYSTGKPFPKINLQGKWLSKLGFEIGNYVEVAMKDNQIIITKIDNHDDLPLVNYQTTLRKDTLDFVKEHANHYHLDEAMVIERAVKHYLKTKTNTKTTGGISYAK